MNNILNNKWLRLLLLCLSVAGFAGLSGCGKKEAAKEKVSHEQKNVQLNAPSDTLTALQDTVSEADESVADEIFSDYYTRKESTDYLYLDIRVKLYPEMPVLSNSLIKFIKSYESSTREFGRSFKSTCENEPDEDWGMCPSLELSSSDFKIGHFLDVKVTGTEFSGWIGQSFPVEANLIYDVREQKILSTEDVLDFSHKREIDMLIQKHCDKKWLECYKESLGEEEFIRGNHLSDIDLEKADYVRLTDKGMVFFYDICKIAWRGCWQLESLVPYEELKPYMKIDF